MAIRALTYTPTSTSRSDFRKKKRLYFRKYRVRFLTCSIENAGLIHFSTTSYCLLLCWKSEWTKPLQLIYMLTEYLDFTECRSSQVFRRILTYHFSRSITQISISLTNDIIIVIVMNITIIFLSNKSGCILRQLASWWGPATIHTFKVDLTTGFYLPSSYMEKSTIEGAYAFLFGVLCKVWPWFDQDENLTTSWSGRWRRRISYIKLWEQKKASKQQRHYSYLQTQQGDIYNSSWRPQQYTRTSSFSLCRFPLSSTSYFHIWFRKVSQDLLSVKTLQHFNQLHFRQRTA